MKYVLISLTLCLTQCTIKVNQFAYRVNCPGFYSGPASYVRINKDGTQIYTNGRVLLYPISVKCEVEVI